MGNIYLPQFAGRSNPYDELWYLAIEIGRTELLKITSIGDGMVHEIQSKSEAALREKYEELTAELSNLSTDERLFLKKDSNVINKISIHNTNNDLMELSKKSLSDMTFMHSIDSKDYLCATLGDDAGEAEFERRIALLKKFKGIKLTENVIKENSITEEDVDFIKSVREAGLEFIMIKG